MTRLCILLPLVAVSACVSTSSARDKHAHFHHCSASAVNAEETEVNGQTAVRTTGCGGEELFLCIGAKCRSARLLAVRLFSAKFSCAEGEVVTSEEKGDVWTATGCGKTQRYHCPAVPREVVECSEAK